MCESDELRELMERNGFKPGTFCYRHSLAHPASRNPWPRVSGWISRTGSFCLDPGATDRPGGWIVTHRWSGYSTGAGHSDVRDAVAFIADLEVATSPEDWMHASVADLARHGLFVVAKAIRVGYPNA